MVANTKPEMIIIGYHPLLYSTPSTYYGQDAIEAVKKLSELEEVMFTGILWASEDGVIKPIIICNKAKAVIDHLMMYSEGSPSNWFKIFYGKVNDSFVLTLMPDVNKLVERYTKNSGIESVEKYQLNYVFKPICVIIEKVTQHCQAFLDQNSQNVEVSMIELDNVISQQDGGQDYEPILIDKFEKCGDDWYGAFKLSKEYQEFMANS